VIPLTSAIVSALVFVSLPGLALYLVRYSRFLESRGELTKLAVLQQKLGLHD